MEQLEGLKKAGVVGMFILPPPSWKLRLVVKDGDNEMVQDASRAEFNMFRSYLNQIESGEVIIPDELLTEVTVRKAVPELITIKDDEYIFSELEKIIISQFTDLKVYVSPKKVWEGILESRFDLKGRSLAVYLKTVYLYICELRNDVKNDLLLRKEVRERLLLDGIYLNSTEAMKEALQLETKVIDQDDIIDKFRKACEERNLEKGKTIPQETLFEIGQEIMPSKVGKVEDFKDGSEVYHHLRQYASVEGYKKKQKKE
jgi:hypothetical protein